MALESGTYIDSLNAANPVATDGLAQADDHLRLIKSTIKASFPNITGAVNATHTELNTLDGITATTAELNIMDGVTATTTEINLLDGVTATTSELNILDGVTATTSELNILDGVTATTAELNYMDGVTSNVQTQLNTLDTAVGNVTSYPTIVHLSSGSSYTIPSGKKALYVYVAGAGGGGAVRDGSNAASNGSTGGNTTLSNSTLGINITASGGTGGQQPEGFRHKYDSLAGSSTGTVYKGKGGQGGRQIGDEFDISPTAGLNGTLVKQYVASSSVGGQTLTYSIGSGGSGGSAAGEVGETGHKGWIELWIW